MPRNRLIYLALVILIIPLGLFTRSSYMPMQGGFISTYAGDTLWSAMIYFMLCVAFPKWTALRIAIVALSFSYAIEISQLCQQDWLNSLRNTRLGALVLGRGFLWSDFLCYSAGVFLAWLIDFKIASSKKKH